MLAHWDALCGGNDGAYGFVGNQCLLVAMSMLGLRIQMHLCRQLLSVLGGSLQATVIIGRDDNYAEIVWSKQLDLSRQLRCSIQERMEQSINRHMWSDF